MLENQHRYNREDGGIVELAGEVTVEQVQLLQQTLLENLRQHDVVRIDGSKVERIDFFALQMLCSAHRTAMAWKKSLVWASERPPAIRDAMRLNGFMRNRGCNLCPEDVSCMWP